MKTIKLCKGAGNGVDSACLATAVAMIAGKSEEKDHPSCLCPVIAAFIRPTNDAMPDEIRANLYGDLPWHLVGTKADLETEVKRSLVAADYAVRRFSPLLAREWGAKAFAETLESLPPIVDGGTAWAAWEVMKGVAWSSTTIRWAAISAADAGRAAALGADARAAAGAASMVARLRERGVPGDGVWPLCRQLVLDMAAIGSKTPIEPCYTPESLAAVLNK